jgi:uncharacterized membrane protein YbaN (DUF454 family)
LITKQALPVTINADRKSKSNRPHFGWLLVLLNRARCKDFMGTIKRNLLIICGTISVGLGIFGIFLPILPTTPFLLLAAFLYAKSSPRFYNWLINNRYLGEYIRNYREGRGMPLNQKVFVIILMWLTMGVSVWIVPQWWLKALLVTIGMGVTIHLIRIKTYKSVSGIAEKSSEPKELL